MNHSLFKYTWLCFELTTSNWYSHSFKISTSSTFTMREEKEESQSCISSDEKLHVGKKRSRYKLWLGLGAIAALAATALAIAICLTLRHQNERDNGSNYYVDLGYSRYTGNSFKDGTTQWLGIRYAAPPVGNLRFAAPQDPLRNTTIQAANEVSKALSHTQLHMIHSVLISLVVPSSMPLNAKLYQRQPNFTKSKRRLFIYQCPCPFRC